MICPPYPCIYVCFVYHLSLPFFLPFAYHCLRLCASRSLLPCLTLARIWTISRSGLVFTVLARCPCVLITANHCTSTNASKGFFFHSFRYIAVAYPSGGTLCVSSASATPVSTREPFCRDPRPPREKLCPADHELEGYVQGFDIGSLQRAEWKPAQKKNNINHPASRPRRAIARRRTHFEHLIPEPRASNGVQNVINAPNRFQSIAANWRITIER